MKEKPTHDESEKKTQERSRAMDKTREVGKQFSDVIGFLPDATFAISREGRVIVWNRAIEELSGINAKSVIGKGNYEYAVPLHGIRRPMLIDLVLRPDEKFEKEYSFIKREGEYLLAESAVSLKGKVHILWGKAGPLYDCNGNIIGAIESIRDITEWKQAEEALRDSNERFKELAELLPEIIFETDAKGKLTFVNRNAYDYFRYTQQDFDKGLNAINMVALEDRERALENINAILGGDQLGLIEYTSLRNDGSTFPILIHSTAILRKGKPSGIRGIIIDITEQKIAEKALLEKKKELKEKAHQLEEMNTALKVLLEHTDNEMKKAQENIVMNIRKLILPHLEKLEQGIPDHKNRVFINIIKSDLEDIIAPYVSRISSEYTTLTPTELQIVDLIKNDKSTKEIASLINVSTDTISFHRLNIRKKFGILNKKINLRSFLQSLSA